MNATRLTMIVFSTAAVVISGCSGDSRVTGPGTDDFLDRDQVELTTPAETENDAARLAVESQEQKIERVSFEVTAKKSDVEGGCWYLETADGVRYTPYFEANAPRLYAGKRFFVHGYVDGNLNSFCMIGPVFRIEKYMILSGEEYAPTSDIDLESTEKATARSASGEADTDVLADVDAESRGDKTALKGYYFSNDEGCIYISDEKGVIVELHFTWLKCPNIQDGTLIAVEGEYSLLTWSPCQLAPLFNVDKFQVLEENHLVAQDGREGK